MTTRDVHNSNSVVQQDNKNQGKPMVALVNMPFASVDYPSLALGMLKPVVQAAGYQSRTYNFNIPYAQLRGLKAYQELSNGAADPIGEQVFSHLLYPDRLDQPEFFEYVTQCVPIRKFQELVDQASEFIDICAHMVTVENPCFVGFTTTFHQKAASFALAAAIRKRSPSTILGLGGASCESPMGEALLSMFNFVDVVFHGEADTSLRDFLIENRPLTRRKLKKGDGYSVRDDEGIQVGGSGKSRLELSELSPPDYNDFVEELNLNGLGRHQWQLPFELSRGCWWGQKNHCTFCGLNALHMEYRQRDMDQAICQLKDCLIQYGPRRVIFSDNIAPVRVANELADKLGEISGFTYFFEVKSNLKYEELLSFKRNRILHIQPGIERLNTQVLKSMKKGNSASMNIALLRQCSELGVEVLWNYLLGFPNETAAEIEREILLLPRLFSLPPPHGANRVRLDRYSPLFDHPEKFGIQRGAPMIGERWLFNNEPQSDQASYFFELELANEYACQMQGYWDTLQSLINDWVASHRPKQLVAKSHGKAIHIVDRRMAIAIEIEVSGASAELLNMARNPVPFSKILSSSDLVPACEALLEHNLGVVVDDCFVALTEFDQDWTRLTS